MSTTKAVTSVTLPAAADYSTTGQYLFVNCDANGRAVVVSSQGAQAIGVLANDPSAIDQAATVDILGVTKVTAGASITAGNKITVGADARAEVAASGDHVMGIALEGGADGEIIQVLLGVGPPVLA